MSVHFTRPTSCFDSGFTPQILEGADFLTTNEKYTYNKAKEKIQEDFLKKKLLEATVTFDKMTVPSKGCGLGMTHATTQRLVGNLINRGFDVLIAKEQEKSLSEKVKLTVFIPENYNTSPDGRASPGWRDEFKATSIKKNHEECVANIKASSTLKPSTAPVDPSAIMTQEAMDKIATEAYQSTASMIQYHIEASPDVIFHSFCAANTCPKDMSGTVMGWVAEDLRKQGFNVEESTGMSQPIITISKPLNK